MLDLGLSEKIAVTGGIASGKSAVCSLFKELGAYVLSADEIVHQLLVPTTHFGKSIIDLLGPDIVEGGRLSRERIAQKVFRESPLLLKALEKLIHPEVQRVIEAKYKAVSHLKRYPLFVVEVPLLFESGQESFYDKVLVVSSSEEDCKKRFRFDADEYERRSERLIPVEDKIKKADLVIENNGSLEDLRQTIQTIVTSLKENS